MKNYNKKNIIIFGLGNSGRSVLKYYYKKKIYVIAWDDNLFTRNKIKKEFPKIQINNLKNINWKNINIVIVAPGISLKHPLLSNSYKYNVRNYKPILLRERLTYDHYCVFQTFQYC